MIVYKQSYCSRSKAGAGGLNIRNLQYIATRPGAIRNQGQDFGLWGKLPGDPDAAEQRDFNKVKETIRQASEDRTIYRAVISAKKEDAENYGLYHRERWEALIKNNVSVIAQGMGIREENFAWVASFHKELGHPHIHMQFWDSGTGVQPEGLSPERMKILSEKVRASIGRDVYGEEILREQKLQAEQIKEMRTALRAACLEANPEQSLNIRRQLQRPETEELAEALRKVVRAIPETGSLRYAYLPPEVKALVDSFTDRCIASVPELAKTMEEFKTATRKISEMYGNGEEAEQHYLVKAMGELRRGMGNEVMNAVRDVLATEPQQAAKPKVTRTEWNTDEIPALSEEAPPEEDPTAPLEGAAEKWGGEDRYNGKHQGGGNWWSKNYKEAKTLLYGTKTEAPDLPLAFQKMEAEAKAGNGLAMHDLAKMYLSGLGCEKDDAAAQSWFAKALAAFTDREATDRRKDYWQYRIGKMYNMGYGTERDYSKAAEWYGKASAGGNVYAAYSLGSLYYRGQGVEQDFNEAFRLYHKAAAETDNPTAYAAYSLAGMYAGGKGTETDKAEAEKWYKIAYRGFRDMEKDNPDDKLYYRLGRMELDGVGTDVNYSAAEAHFQKAAKLGNNYARYGLARLYLDHKFDGYDPAEAVKHLIPAAQQGHPDSQYLLGKLLIQGNEIPADLKAGENWLLKAIAQGNDPAAVTLAKAYLPDGALPPNIPKAVELLDGAYQKGNVSAAYLLGKTLSTEESVLDIPKALKCLTYAAENGNDFAEYRLGMLYFFGKGDDLKRDKDKGLDYLQSAADHGNEYAQNFLDHMSKTQTVDLMCDLMHLLSMFASHQGAGASQGKPVSRDMSREAKRDKKFQQENSGMEQ